MHRPIDTSLTFRRELKISQQQHPLFLNIHPFWRDGFRGRLEREEIRRWALDVYPLVRDFSQLYIQVAAKCKSERVLTFLSETIYEETGSGKESESHPTLFRGFLKSLGVAESAIAENPTTTAGQSILEYSWRTVREGSFVEALALVGLAIERPLPAFFKMIARAFQKRLDLSEEDVRFFSVHTIADVKHSQVAARIVAEEAHTDDQRTSVHGLLNHIWDLQLAQLNELNLSRNSARRDR